MSIELNAGETKRLDVELVPIVQLGGIQGHIINYNTGGHVPGAKMVVDGQLTFYSQGDGSYSISGLPCGMRYIVIEAEGYRTATFHADVTPEIQNIDFQLVPLGYGGAILEYDVPSEIHQQDILDIHCKIKNTGDAGEQFYARIQVDGQWLVSIISTWLEPGEVYEKTGQITFYDVGTFTVTCVLTGYEKEDVRDQASAQVTVLPKEFPNLLTLDQAPTHLFDRSRGPAGYELIFPGEANPQLLSIPQAYFKGEDLSMDIQYSLLPNQISDYLRNNRGWYWELFIFNKDDVYNLPFYPDRYGGMRPTWHMYFEDQSLTAASIKGWNPYQEIITQVGWWHTWQPEPPPPTDLYPESEGWFFKKFTYDKTFWVACRYLKDAPGTYPLVIRVMYYPAYEGHVAGYEDLWRAWKVGQIIVP